MNPTGIDSQSTAPAEGPAEGPTAPPAPPALPAPAPWWRGTRGEWYVVVQFALFAAIALSSRLWPTQPAWPAVVTQVAAVVGLALMVSGAALAVWGLLALGRNNLTALPYPPTRPR